ncbi:PREDICTED: peroxidase 7 [Tarenaya hassleriana]|uniref:peroxidase 7 n=1 Tax=Tarenaya hassleriana TaxID=28532 RepID=UPI00053C2872|nr:PREDICTED: peroxidase 7 [Tarenaya hassleriana]
MKPVIVSTLFLLLGLGLAVADGGGGGLKGIPGKYGGGDDSKPSLPLDNLLSFNYYRKSCPNFEKIVETKVREWLKNDYSLGPGLLRLLFHDCGVTGCDASILLDYDGTERRSPASLTLKGFQVIDDIKSELETQCPGKVSCSDILTAASRDATVVLGGPYWSNAYGRRDSLVSYARDAEGVPSGRRDVTALLEIFQSYGLNIIDLVVLSGAHTIGKATCGTIQSRLYNFNATGAPDPSLDPKFGDYLRRKCRWASEYVDLDAVTPTQFDNQFYKNLQSRMGVLTTDQELVKDVRTAPLVKALAEQPSQMFRQQFAVSMFKLVNVGVITGQDRAGEIRKVCSKSNSRPY